MDRIFRAFFAASALLVVSTSCTTPPPVRDVPSEAWQRVPESVLLRHLKLDAAELIRDVSRLLAESDTGLSEVLEQDLHTSMRELELAQQGRNADAILKTGEPLDQHMVLIVDHRIYAKEVTERRKVVGAAPGSSANSEIDHTLAEAKRALQGTSWEEVQKTRNALEELSRKLVAAGSYQQLLGDLLALGSISPVLSRQMDEALQPLRRALQEGDWDSMRDQAEMGSPQFKYPTHIREQIEKGSRLIEQLQPTENQQIVSAVAAVRAALQGDSWQQAEMLANEIDNAASALGGYGATPCVRILSIDGGGIRGIIPATFLQDVERRTGRPIFELFDVIAGTSTGGILALGLTVPDTDDSSKARYSAAQLIDMYETDGKEIFPATPLKSIRGFFGPKYRAPPLEEVLKKYFGKEVMLVEALTNVIIPTYALEDPGHVLLNNYEKDTPHIYTWEAARATSAAPTYFPPYRMPLDRNTAGQGLIDGGVFANNPAAYALAVAKRVEHLDRHKPYDNQNPLLLLSLGTGRVPSTTRFEDAWDRGSMMWISPLINILLSDPGVEEEARHLMAPTDYYLRLQPKMPSGSTQLDDVSPGNIEHLKQVADEYLREAPVNWELEQFIGLLKRKRSPQCERIVDPFGERETLKSLTRLPPLR